jgi:hypothetical protein
VSYIWFHQLNTIHPLSHSFIHTKLPLVSLYLQPTGQLIRTGEYVDIVGADRQGIWRMRPDVASPNTMVLTRDYARALDTVRDLDMPRVNISFWMRLLGNPQNIHDRVAAGIAIMVKGEQPSVYEAIEGIHAAIGQPNDFVNSMSSDRAITGHEIIWPKLSTMKEVTVAIDGSASPSLYMIATAKASPPTGGTARMIGPGPQLVDDEHILAHKGMVSKQLDDIANDYWRIPVIWSRIHPAHVVLPHVGVQNKEGSFNGHRAARIAVDCRLCLRGIYRQGICRAITIRNTHLPRGGNHVFHGRYDRIWKLTRTYWNPILWKRRKFENDSGHSLQST